MAVPLRVLTIGDIHFKTTNVKESQDMCKAIFNLLNREGDGIDVIVVMGDTLDRHENIHVVPLVQSVKFLTDLAKIKKTYLLIGNHDRPNNADFLSDYHPFNGLKDVNNLIVVDKVIQETINDMKFVFVPYVYPGRFMEAIKTNKDIDLSNVKTVFAHQEFFATKMGAVISVVGDKWPHDYPFVISGHIHDYCRPQDNIVYVGTPMQHAFGDSDDKTVSIFDISKEIKPEERRVDLGLIKRKIYELDCNQVNGWVPPSEYLVKLIINGTASEIKAIMKLDHIKVLTKKGVKIVYNTLDEIKIGVNKTIKREELNLSYVDRLKNAVSKNEGVLYWYNRIFSGV